MYSQHNVQKLLSVKYDGDTRKHLNGMSVCLILYIEIII